MKTTKNNNLEEKMKTITRKTLGIREIKVAQCPYCNEPPIIDSPAGEIKAYKGELPQPIVSCGYCELSAPLDVWNAIAERFSESIVNADDVENEKLEKSYGKTIGTAANGAAHGIDTYCATDGKEHPSSFVP
jgi:hypothetical protein